MRLVVGQTKRNNTCLAIRQVENDSALFLRLVNLFITPFRQ